jgi:hypothetical protein
VYCFVLTRLPRVNVSNDAEPAQTIFYPARCRSWAPTKRIERKRCRVETMMMGQALSRATMGA